MIPYTVVNVLREFVDISIDLYGIECSLFIPNNLDEVDDLGVYAEPTDITYDEYTSMIWVEWSPNMHRLRKLGIFAEDESPMIARLGSTATSVSSGQEVEDVEVVPRSYVQIPMQYVPDDMDTDEFELVNVQIEATHDAIAVKMWKLVPRRVKE